MTSTQQIQGQVDGSLDFDGANDGLNIASFTIGTNFTYEAWINATSVTGGNGFRGIMLNGNYNRWLGLGTSGTTSGIIDFWDGTNDNFFGTALSTNTWYHIVATYDGTNLRVYRDGALRGTQAKGYTAQTNTFHIGYSQPINAEFFAGTIDEVRVSSVIRSQPWIQTEYNNQNARATLRPDKYLKEGKPSGDSNPQTTSSHLLDQTAQKHHQFHRSRKAHDFE
jgi:hypothetical protein